MEEIFSTEQLSPEEHVLKTLGLEGCQEESLDLTTMLEINTWNPEDPSPQAPTDLPSSFLRRLWLLSPQARSTWCHTPGDTTGQDADFQYAVNPLDLVTSVYMSASYFLRQEMTIRMFQCQFAVPMLLPHGGSKGQENLLLLSPLQSVVRWYKPNSKGEGTDNLEEKIFNTQIPFLSFIRLGSCNISKSQVLNQLISGSQGPCESFVHCGMNGGKLDRKLSNGLVEVIWYLSSKDHKLKLFSEAVMLANLRGDATNFRKQNNFLNRISSVILVFCGNLDKEECHLLASWKGNNKHLILVDCSQADKEVNGEQQEERKQVTLQKLAEDLEITVLPGSRAGAEQELADRLIEAVNQMIPESLHSMSWNDMTDIAKDLGITVDENLPCHNALARVDEVLKGVKEQGRTKYKEIQLPLQTQECKKLLSQEYDARPKGNKTELQRENNSQHEELNNYKMTAAISSFINALSAQDKQERAFFLQWIKLELDALSQELCLSVQQSINSIDETLDKSPVEIKEGLDSVLELEMQQQDSFLGLEHFTQEMQLIFELSQYSPNIIPQNALRLPALAAELLFFGLPLELVDRETSTIPQTWLNQVLTEVHKRIPKGKRLRVLTVLGLHSARNSSVLSALFGLTFTIAYTSKRSAYMMILCVPEILRKELDFDLLLLINTEKLKCPDVLQQKDRFKEDNELATLLIGLSDVTLLNLPLEEETEIHQTLLVMTNAFLRLKETDRIPFFLFVTHGSGMDKKLLGLQLNRFTKVLTAGMSNPAGSKYYSCQDCETESHCLLTLCQNPAPMMQIDPGYSKAVLKLKQHVLAMLSKHPSKSPNGLLEFMDSTCQLWEAVKNDNNIFGLRTTQAFCNLCAEVSYLERALLRHMDDWMEHAENLVSQFNISTPAPETSDGTKDSDSLLSELKEKASKEIMSETSKIISKVEEVFKTDNSLSNLTDIYQDNFTSSVGRLQEEVKCQINNKLEASARKNDLSIKTKDFQATLETALEAKLKTLLEESKTNDGILEEKQLNEEFTKCWSETLSKLGLKPLATQNITTKVADQLKENLMSHGISKHLNKLKDIVNHGTSPFLVTDEHFSFRNKLKKMFNEDDKVDAQKFSDKVINECDKYIEQTLCQKEDYLDRYIDDVLKIVDDAMSRKWFDVRSVFEVDLKLHICAKAAKSFQEMHNNFIRKADPLMHFEGLRERQFWEFLYKFLKRDKCQKAARDFTLLCLKPAALDYIHGPLGKMIIEEMVSGKGAVLYHSPQNFWYNILKELLLEDNFKNFLEYLVNSESFLQKRIRQQVVEHLSSTGMLAVWRQERFEQIMGKMDRAVRQCLNDWTGVQGDTKLLLEHVCKNLESCGDVVVPQHVLQGPLFQYSMVWKDVVACLLQSLGEMWQSLTQEFSQLGNSPLGVSKTLEGLSSKLEDELYLRVRGCEKQCPFCKAPCDVRDTEHTEHKSRLHRPKGLLSFTCTDSSSLSYNSCNSNVASDNMFLNKDTDGQPVPYKDYQTIYPEWIIPPETHGVNLYWKYVLARYNERFAQEYQSQPAQLPEDWKEITREEALENLKEIFGVPQP
ncbi:interferon-induced very large GTPase 1-like [Scleropages formosus]|uniref:Interferon-induced very large GTPase 1-like n=1 Tax=Scleropages formosus TaxID=113540 RepID=A0A0P7YV49_SCLFO|nr:interferon-induced very large GTPase 1-like [Scleropages formosus]